MLLLDPREQGASPKILKGAGSMTLVTWEQGSQKIAKGSREYLKMSNGQGAKKP